MLKIIMGRAGSGKSRAVMQSIAENRALRPQILLVPEHVTHEAEMDLCRCCGPTASRDTEALSFQSLARRVLQTTGGLSEVTLDNGGKVLTMRRCLQELCTRLRVFGTPSHRSAFLQELVTLCDELYAYDVEPAALYKKVEQLGGAMGDKLRDVALLFAAYDSRLHNSQMDVRSRVQKLRDALGESDYLQGKDLYFDGFSFFNRVEEEIFETALRQCSSVTVTLLGDRRFPDYFLNAAAQRDRLTRLAARQGVPCEIEYRTSECRTALQHLEKNFFDGDAPWQGDCGGITLYQANTAFSEVEHLAAAVRRLARGGCRYRDMAVAARNMDVYGPLLEMVFAREGIPIYISRRSSILDKSILTMLLSAVDAVAGGFEYEDMFRYLKTGLAGISQDECDLLENYVILWQIRGRMWLSDTPWTANPDGYGAEMTAARQETLERVNAIRQKVAAPLKMLYDGILSNKTAEDKAKTLYSFAEISGVPAALTERTEALLAGGEVQLAEEYRQLWQIFCDVLDQFVTILGDTELDSREFSRILRLVFRQYSVGTIPATMDQVKVSEITRNDRHSVKHLFLLGANDHVLPQVQKQAGILDDADRMALRACDITLSDATFDALDNELQNIYACLAQPTESLQISWPVTDLMGSELRPSFVVGRVRNLFPAVGVSVEDGADCLLLVENALAEAAIHPGGTLRQYFAQKQEYGAVLSAMERAADMQRGRLSPQAVESLYGRSISLSASRMDRVKSCHFGYFMEYGLRARERKSAGFEAPEVGTFLHYLLENVVREVDMLGGFGAVERDTLHALVKKYVQTYAETQLDGFAEKSARFKYLFGRLRKTAYAIVDDMAAEFRESDFQPMAFELAFGGKNSDIPAITIHENNTALAVNGKVDRVDGWLKDGKLYLRVVDYKTGKKSFDLTDIRYGLGIQMLLYLFTLQRQGSSYFGYPIVPAGVLYHSAKNDIIKVTSGAAEDEVARLLQKQCTRSGMVLGEPEVLRAMEHSALESPCYLPIRFKKDGTITEGVASAEQLGHLGRYVEKLLHDIAREITQGNIDADPCSHDPRSSACTYCPFVSACYFEEGRDRRRYIKKTTGEDFWSYVKEEVRDE